MVCRKLLFGSGTFTFRLNVPVLASRVTVLPPYRVAPPLVTVKRASASVMPVLIALSFIPKTENRRAVYRLCITFTAVQSIAAAFPIPGLSPLLRALPLNKLGFGWLIPAAVGLLLGLFISQKSEKA